MLTHLTMDVHYGMGTMDVHPYLYGMGTMDVHPYLYGMGTMGYVLSVDHESEKPCIVYRC